MSGPQSAADRHDWLRLIRSENVGPITFRQLLRRYGSAAAALDALPGLAERGGKRRIRIAAPAEATREIEALGALGGRHLFWGEPDYPQALAMLDDAPPALSIKGTVGLLGRPKVAVVGARNASASGRKLAADLARGLGAAGLVVVSGLARGIDGAAHAASLDSGTIAVLGGGLDIVYPPENAELQARIGEAGLLLAEMPVGTQPLAQHFPRRNRLISGLSYGVVVVEAALKSGSLITARFALEQGREVFAVPGSPLDARAGGPNDLIKRGAHLTERAEDVLAVVRPMLDRPLAEPPGQDRLQGLLPLGGPPQAPDERVLAAARTKIAELLSPTPTALDDLVRLSGLSPELVLVALLELELAGKAQRLPGQRVVAGLD